MTQSFNPVTTPNPAVHRPPQPAQAPFSAAQTSAFGEALVDEIVGSIAIAIGNTEVLGMKPFAFLSVWGKSLEDKAAGLIRNLYGPDATEPQPNIVTGALPTGFQNIGNDITRITQDILAGIGLSSTGSWADLSAAFSQLETDVEQSIVQPTLPATPVIGQDVVSASSGWISDINSGVDTVVNATIGAFDPNLAKSVDNFSASVTNFVSGLFGQETAPAAGTTPTAGFIGDAHNAASGAQSAANGIQAGLYGGTSTAPAPVGSTVLATAVPNLPATQIESATGTAGQTLSTDLAAISEPFQAGGLFDPTAWSDAMTGLGNLLGVHPTALPSTGSTAQIASAQVSSPVAGDANVGVTAQNAHAAAGVAQSGTQSVVDAINNAVNGGNATGTPVSQVAGNLTQIPQNNIRVNPASGNPAPVTFDAAGAGAASGPYSVTQNGTTVSWSHTVGTAANYLLVPVYYPGPLQPAAPSFIGTATRSSDGQSFMLPQITLSDDTNVLTMLGALIEPGTYTIAVTSNVEYPNTGPGFVCSSASYCNVNTVGITTAHSSGSASASMGLSFPSQPNNSRALAVVYWGNTAASSTAAAISGLTGVTQRLSDTFTTGSTGTAIALGDVIPTGTNTSFSATAASATGNAWMATEILLEPPTTTVGSFAKVTRENTTAVSVPVNASTIPASSYDTTAKMSPDITFTNGNTFTATYAGTYLFEIGVNFSPAITANNYFMFQAVINGVSQLMGYVGVIPSQAGASIHSAIYLDPGSTVTWTATNLTTAAAWGFVGNANGTSWMSLTLMNRSLL